MRHLLLCLLAFAVTACVEPVTDVDLGDALAVEEACGDDCTTASTRVGLRLPLDGRAHGVAGVLVVQNDRTLVVEDFAFDGGGLDVRAVVGDSLTALSAGDYTVISEDLRRSGGYQNARVEFTLPEAQSVDDVGVFSIWCVPANANFAHTEL